jgi:hypothetical protein
MEKKVVKMEKNLLKMEKVKRMEKNLAILEKIIVTIPRRLGKISGMALMGGIGETTIFF